ncbi:MAG: hypothetical protein KC516_02420 [Nanoarchaeota archaeon]|nr:hypothetical protein [Nanoarchaeota archaeon]
MAKKRRRSSGNKVNAVNFGYAGGIFFGAVILLMTLAGIIFRLFPETLSLVADWYGWLGYDVTIFGAILGAIYGFIDGFVFLWIVAKLYNRMA